MKCLCCNHIFDEFTTDSVCDYCGFEAIETLSDEDEKKVSKLAEDHRKDVLSKLHGLSVKATLYQWNAASSKYNQKGRIELFDPKPDGTACSAAPVFSKEWVAHIEGKADISAHYYFGGMEKAFKTQIKLEPQVGIWYLGLRIDESLRLEILLGIKPVDGDSISETKKLTTIDLDYHA